ncbi:thioesterase family protein [Xanthobacter tagetidis]|jgi:acyl-CoA thioester hydrolase|uniref:Thioesterase n=1 Tax=Xanthobacter tagetidis TaxID=60216 RepID=A0A3L7A989_9HYPH|nr:thioesterase family protein [Xanthobacter tagetidis]MBB6309330.1 acyl-CoA thioester hydrolase [Xanthobacter tagetidis]RLP76644.1 thioesterase [Xanthobacter tagetidis]
MLHRIDFEPVFFAPFVSSAMKVEREWIDYNGHLNMAYYNLLFDRAVDEASQLLGLGPDYAETCGASFFTAEAHVRYLRELKPESPVRVTLRLVDYDDKRLHLFQTLHHAIEGWESATCEQVAIHVDLASRRAVPFPDDVLALVATMRAAHAALPRPEGLGRSVAMAARAS